MPHRFLVWTVRPLLVVVAKLRTNKEKDKKALGPEIGNSHVDSLHFRLYAPFFIYYLYVYRGDSLTLGNRYLTRFVGVANDFSRREALKCLTTLWEGFGREMPT